MLSLGAWDSNLSSNFHYFKFSSPGYLDKELCHL